MSVYLSTVSHSPKQQWLNTDYGINAAVNGQISGNVKLDGVNKTAWGVFLLDRNTPKVISHTYTNSSGNYIFDDLDASAANRYMVVAYDPNGTNGSLVYDLITPA